MNTLHALTNQSLAHKFVYDFGDDDPDSRRLRVRLGILIARDQLHHRRVIDLTLVGRGFF